MSQRILDRLRITGSDYLARFRQQPSLLEGCDAKTFSAGAPVDAVYTFVDMSDPAWIARWQSVTSEAPSARRYANHGELAYSIRLLEKHCPWIRNIFVVTPTPLSVRVSSERLRIISDDELLGDECARPTFKSCSIESYLHRIPGLSDYFLYLCDDCFVGTDIPWERFLGKDGCVEVELRPRDLRPQVRTPARLKEAPWEHDIVNVSRCIERRFGKAINLGYTHGPTIMCRQACELAWEYFPDELRRSVAEPFRQPLEDTVHFVLLSQIVGILTGYLTLKVVPRGLTRYLGETARNDAARFFNELIHEPASFFCLNYIDEQNADLFQLFQQRFDRPVETRRVFYVCSYGGAGSTMLTRFLNDYGRAFHVHSRTPPVRLTRIEKTPHYPYAPEWFSQDQVDNPARYTVIFIYRHPTYAQLAGTGVTGKPVYNPIHHRNIQVPEALPEDIHSYIEACLDADRELLGYGEIFRNYVFCEHNADYDIICIDYDRLWECLDEVMLTLGLPPDAASRFPPRKPSKHARDPVIVDALNRINSELIDTISEVPPVRAVPARMSTASLS